MSYSSESASNNFSLSFIKLALSCAPWNWICLGVYEAQESVCFGCLQVDLANRDVPSNNLPRFSCLKFDLKEN